MITKQCYSASLQVMPCKALPIKVLDTRDEGKVISIEMVDRLLQVSLDSRFLELVIKISSELS